jgi:hypothetical protein
VKLVKNRATRARIVLLFLLPAALTACSKEDEAAAAFDALADQYSEGTRQIGEERDSLAPLSENPDSAELAVYRVAEEASRAEQGELREASLPQFEALAEDYWGTGGGLDAKVWILYRTAMPEDDEEVRAAIVKEHVDAIFEEYAESPYMDKLGTYFYVFNEEEVEHYFGDLRENSPHANVRAAAIYLPTEEKLRRLRWDDRLEDAEARADIDADLHLLMDEYGDVPLGGSTYGALAYAHLNTHTAEELAIGMPAPEIIGTTLDGEEMRLSDFLGKVTVIDFWGDW